MVHWNNLSAGARALLTKLVEGSCYDPADDHLAKLLECGLIEPSADGWQATPAGRSAYVIRDHRREKNPARGSGSYSDAS
jgi:hypothetical protein